MFKKVRIGRFEEISIKLVLFKFVHYRDDFAILVYNLHLIIIIY